MEGLWIEKSHFSCFTRNTFRITATILPSRELQNHIYHDSNRHLKKCPYCFYKWSFSISKDLLKGSSVNFKNSWKFQVVVISSGVERDNSPDLIRLITSKWSTLPRKPDLLNYVSAVFVTFIISKLLQFVWS